MTSVPGFPRRGIPIPRKAFPTKPEPVPPFFKTAMGRRVILYAFGLVAVAAIVVQNANRRERIAQEGAASRGVALTHAPKAFAPTELLHQLRGLEDDAPEPPHGAIAAAIGWLASPGGPESRPATDWTDLDAEQAIAHPSAFRGGLVRVRGLVGRIETVTIKHPAIPDPEGFTYKIWLYVRNRARDAMVTCQTGVMPSGIEKETLVEAEGVFLQSVQYEAKDQVRTTPFVAVGALRTVPPEQAKGILDTLFVPILVSAIILVLLAALFLFRKSRTPPAESPFRVRPPGPGR